MLVPILGALAAALVVSAVNDGKEAASGGDEKTKTEASKKAVAKSKKSKSKKSETVDVDAIKAESYAQGQKDAEKKASDEAAKKAQYDKDVEEAANKKLADAKKLVEE